jgi:phytoene synthase
MDLDQNRYADFKQLQLYCYRVASVVGLLSVQIFGFKDRKTLKYAHDLGMALQLTNIIRDVGEDARRNRIYLPLDELKKFGVTEAEILNSQSSDRTQALLEFQIERAETFYDRALLELPSEDRKTQRTGLMMAAIYRTLLREIKADNPIQVLNARISLPPLRKFWLACKTFIKY